MTTLRIAIAVAVALCAARSATAQAPGADSAGVVGLGATRQRLEARAENLEQLAQSPRASTAVRGEAAREATTIRQRLTEGDFKVGDRVLLAVEGEAALSDTFTIGLGSAITLPVIGDVSLRGVLRSELQPYLARRLGQNLRDPVVRARAYVRLSIEGAVVRPGFYGVPAEALLSDALMSAGGPTPEAELRKLHIDRAGRPIWQGKALQQAIAQGRTIDDAGLVAGDQYVMPHRGRTSAGDVLRFGGYLLTIPVTLYTLTRIF